MKAALITAALLAPASGDDDALERAMAALSPASIEADLDFLCDPALGGRGTATAEGEAAALYVRSRVRRLGLAPGSTDGYLPRFELVRRRLDGANGELRLADVRLELGRDVFLRGTGDLCDVDLTGGVISAGDGSRRALEAAGSLDGAWALIADRGRGSAGAIRRALEAGAIGVVLTPGPEFAKEPYAERYGRATRRLLEGSLASPLSERPRDADAPAVLMLASSAFTRWADAVGRTRAELLEPGTALGLELTERRRALRESETSPNVAALLPGTDPERADELIVLCAHLDHLGTRNGEVYPGADDNASGSVGLLALAEALVARGPLDRPLLFLWVTGEEAGLWGSAAWCADPRLPEGLAPAAAFNLDMIGRDDPEELWLTPTSEHPAFNPLADLVDDLAPTEGFTKLVSQDSYWAASDHYSFASQLRIPVVYLSSGEHEQYHRPSDTPDLIDVDKLVRILRLHLRLLEASQDVALGDD